MICNFQFYCSICKVCFGLLWGINIKCQLTRLIPKGYNKPQSFVGYRWKVYEGALVSRGNYKNRVIVLYGGREILCVNKKWVEIGA